MDPGGGALNDVSAACLMFLPLEDEGAGFVTKGTGMRTPGAVGGNAVPLVGCISGAWGAIGGAWLKISVAERFLMFLGPALLDPGGGAAKRSTVPDAGGLPNN